MRQIFSNEFTLTKRHLGLLFLAAGLLVLASVLTAEWLHAGGFGTVQKMGALLGAASLLIGLTLLPLGDQPG